MIYEANHLSQELIPVIVLLNDEPTTTEAVDVAFTQQGTEVTEVDWRPIDVAADGTRGYLLPGTLPVGYYDLWARVHAGREVPVLSQTRIRLS